MDCHPARAFLAAIVVVVATSCEHRDVDFSGQQLSGATSDAPSGATTGRDGPTRGRILHELRDVLDPERIIDAIVEFSREHTGIAVVELPELLSSDEFLARVDAPSESRKAGSAAEPSRLRALLTALAISGADEEQDVLLALVRSERFGAQAPRRGALYHAVRDLLDPRRDLVDALEKRFDSRDPYASTLVFTLASYGERGSPEFLRDLLRSPAESVSRRVWWIRSLTALRDESAVVRILDEIVRNATMDPALRRESVAALFSTNLRAYGIPLPPPWGEISDVTLSRLLDLGRSLVADASTAPDVRTEVGTALPDIEDTIGTERVLPTSSERVWLWARRTTHCLVGMEIGDTARRLERAVEASALRLRTLETIRRQVLRSESADGPTAMVYRGRDVPVIDREIEHVKVQRDELERLLSRVLDAAAAARAGTQRVIIERYAPTRDATPSPRDARQR